MSSNRLYCCTIVVVEDHEDARTYFGVFLSGLGANVVLAKDGIEGLDAVKKHDPDLVITDLQMPRMDGFELLREIRGLKPDVRGSVPIIAMTAFGTAIENARLVNLGFQAWMQKPFTIEKFLATIRALLDA
jgi:two-component system chemotaxis response regulator CheY